MQHVLSEVVSGSNIVSMVKQYTKFECCRSLLSGGYVWVISWVAVKCNVGQLKEDIVEVLRFVSSRPPLVFYI